MTRRYTVTTYYEEEKKSSSLFGTCLCIMLIVTIAGFATNNPSKTITFFFKLILSLCYI
jgi:hypothetical protein